MAKGNKTSARSTLAREREAKAMELRKAGKSYTAIGAELKVSDVAAYKMVRRSLDRLEKLTNEEAIEVRRIETERIDTMLAAVWPNAEKGDLDTIATVIKLMGRRAELWGLDAPKQTEIGNIGREPFKLYSGFSPDDV